MGLLFIGSQVGYSLVMNSGTDNKGRLFQNPHLEALTRTSPVMAFTLYPLIASVIFVTGMLYFQLPWLKATGLAIIGFFSWTLMEYLMHRYLFHIGGKSRLVTRFRYLMHGIHHDYPKDADRLIMPPVPWTMYTVVLAGIFYLVIGLEVFAFLPGLLLGYCCYMAIHYLIHVNHPPRFLRKLIIHHSLHHYRFPDHAFGVSSTFWDRVFGTMPPVGKGHGPTP